MNEYRYKFDPSSKKFICPSCGRKTFVLYIDTKTGAYAPTEYGRCDRSNNCTYMKYPESEYKEQSDEFDIVPRKMVHDSLKRYDINIFITALSEKYGVEAVELLLKKYFIGTAKDGSVIFWQVDEQGQTRTGHWMQYNGLSRSKTEFLVHKKVKESFRLKQCLFGLHLVNKAKHGQHINICESEKTALIASIFFPEEIWMACGGKYGLNKYKLLPLYPHPIRLYPDIGCEKDWKEKTESLQNVSIVKWQHDFLGYYNEMNQLKEGDDLADFLVNHTPKELKNNLILN